MAVTLGAVQVGAIFDDQEVLIFFKGSAEHTHTHKKGNPEKAYPDNTYANSSHLKHSGQTTKHPSVLL